MLLMGCVEQSTWQHPLGGNRLCHHLLGKHLSWGPVFHSIWLSLQDSKRPPAGRPAKGNRSARADELEGNWCNSPSSPGLNERFIDINDLFRFVSELSEMTSSYRNTHQKWYIVAYKATCFCVCLFHNYPKKIKDFLIPWWEFWVLILCKVYCS